jgi:hypothetical protein
MSHGFLDELLLIRALTQADGVGRRLREATRTGGAGREASDRSAARNLYSPECVEGKFSAVRMQATA